MTIIIRSLILNQDYLKALQERGISCITFHEIQKSRLSSEREGNEVIPGNSG